MLCFSYKLLGSIDANTGSPDLGWDTDQFPMDIKNCALVMKVGQRGCGGGGGGVGVRVGVWGWVWGWLWVCVCGTRTSSPWTARTAPWSWWDNGGVGVGVCVWDMDQFPMDIKNCALLMKVGQWVSVSLCVGISVLGGVGVCV